jgi:DNA topoisomerase-2
VITFKHSNKTDDELIDLAFAKSKADERKKWIESCRLEETVDHSIKSLTYTEFINKELVQYSVASNARAIPSVIDGLKPGQRKIVFASFKRGLKGEIKVAQLAGYVAEHSAYHHGETSLVGTIINLAQDYIGSNNIPLLLPLGQFGTRAMGGKDAASARYIFTKLSPLTRLLFPESDDGVLNYLEDDGMRVEPEYYVPILPLVLLNGCAGIGMGWSTFIPSYNPMDLIENVKRLLDDKPLEKMTPWYFGFRGSITSDSSQNSSIVITGSYKELNSDTLEITELPIGTWTGDYKEFLESMMTGDKDSQKIAEVKEYHSRGAIHFIIKFREGVLRTLKEDLVKKLRLTSNISLKNMVLFNKDGTLTRYDSPEQILIEFFGVRLRFYTLRKESLIRALEAELRVLSNRVKFINLILENRLELKDRQRTIIEEDMLRLGLEKLGGKNTVTEDAAEEEEDDSGNSFNYLLNMKLSTLTKEKVELLRKSEQEKLDELQRLRETTEKTMWLRDLAKFEEIYNSDVSRRMLECYGKDNFERMKQSVGTVAPGKKSSLTKAEVAPKSNGHSKQNGTKKSAKRSSPEDSEDRSQSESSEEKKPKVKKAEKVLVKRSSKPISSDEKRTSSNGKKSIKSASSKKKAAKAKPVRKRKEASESEDEESEDERSLSDEGEYSDSQYGSDSPPKRQKKIVKRKQKNDSEDLDDSDLELIVKNTKKSKPAPTRRRKPSEDDEEMSEEKKPNKEKSNSKSSSKPKKRKIMLSDDEESEEKAPKPKKRAKIMADSDDSEYNG